jgi:hypothetical protein
MYPASQPAKLEACAVGRSQYLKGEPLKIFDDTICVKLGGADTRLANG